VSCVASRYGILSDDGNHALREKHSVAHEQRTDYEDSGVTRRRREASLIRHSTWNVLASISRFHLDSANNHTIL